MVAQANAEIERLREENGALVLTDMFGATPSNIAARLATVPEVRVLAGVNLPMLVRAVCYRATPLDTLVEKALAGASKGVQTIGPTTPPAAVAAGTCGCPPTPCAEAVAAATDCAAIQATNQATNEAASPATSQAASATRSPADTGGVAAGVLRPAGTT